MRLASTPMICLMSVLSPKRSSNSRTQKTSVRRRARALEINFQRGVKWEPKRLILHFAHRIEASANLVLRSKPHEHRRWLDHTATYTYFKKEMWTNSLWSGRSRGPAA
jgi:hypothetical protein